MYTAGTAACDFPFDINDFQASERVPARSAADFSKSTQRLPALAGRMHPNGPTKKWLGPLIRSHFRAKSEYIPLHCKCKVRGTKGGVLM